MRKSIRYFIVAALLSLVLCAPAGAAVGYIDPNYSGALDPRTGLPASSDGTAEQGSVVMLGEGSYGFDRDRQRYVIPVGGKSFTASIPPGIILDKDAQVSIQLPDGLTGTLYRSGDVVDQPDLSAIEGTGAYLLQVQTTGGYDNVQFGFTIQSGLTRTLMEYTLPSGFSFTSVTINGQEATSGYSNYIELLEEGEYRLSYACPEISRSFSLSFTVDRTAPVLALPEVKDGEARGPVTLSDMEEGTWVNVDNGSEVRQVVSPQTVLSEPGRYTLTACDRAGNSSTYRFIIHFYLNVSAVTAIILAVGAVGGLICYSRWLRRHARVG